MKKLLIVESPHKAQTIQQWLNKNEWKVIATAGHIKNLPKDKYSITSNSSSYEGEWVVIKEKSNLIKEISQHISESEMIFVGTDDDREGERIAFDVVEHFKIKDYYRVIFHEVTKTAIEKALKNGLFIDKNKTNSQKARRIIDRIIGYPITSGIRDNFKKTNLYKEIELKNFGIGRVTAPALNLIVLNEEKIQSFVPKMYRKIFVNYLIDGNQFSTTNGLKFLEEHYEELNTLHKIISDRQTLHVVEEYKQDTRDVSPYPPLITSRLYRSMNYLYHFSPETTKAILQKLYEGVSIFNTSTNRMERVGLVTYPRTDSFNISDEALELIRELIRDKFGEDYLPEVKRNFKNTRQSAQEAHEAIRPTNFSHDFFPKNLRKSLSRDQLSDDEFAIYEFIFYRTITTQMKNAIYDNSKIVVNIGGSKFKAIANKQIFDGWEILMGDKIKRSEDETTMDVIELPTSLKIGDELNPVNISLSEPRPEKTPPRIGIGRFITILDEKNIARPSTIGDVASNLIRRGLVSVSNNMIIPTQIGNDTIDFLRTNGEWLINLEHAEQFEKSLDLIEAGDDSFALIAEYDKLKTELLGNIGYSYGLITDTPEEWLIEKAKKLATANNYLLTEFQLGSKKELNKYIQTVAKTTIVSKCPLCKSGEVHEREKTFSCNRMGCGYTIWKNDLQRFMENFGKILPEHGFKPFIQHIIKNKKIWFEDLYSKNKKKNFKAFVTLEEAEGATKSVFKLALSFPKNDVKTIEDKYIYVIDNNQNNRDEVAQQEANYIGVINTNTLNGSIQQQGDAANPMAETIKKLEEEKRQLMEIAW